MYENVWHVRAYLLTICVSSQETFVANEIEVKNDLNSKFECFH